MGDPRNQRAWKNLAARVVDEEPRCYLRLPGCTGLSTTADHVIPIRGRWGRPDLAMDRGNLRGACLHCNSSKGDRLLHQLRRPAPSPALEWFD